MEQYGEVKSVKIRMTKNGNPGNVGMVCFGTKLEAQNAITELNQTTRFIAKEYRFQQLEIQEKEDTDNQEKRYNKEKKQTESENSARRNRNKLYENEYEEKSSQVCFSCGSSDHKIRTCKKKNNNLSVLLSGLLPRDNGHSINRNKIEYINYQLEKFCRDNSDFYFVDTGNDWTTENGNLKDDLFLHDNLHLVEKGNFVFSNIIYKHYK